MVEIRNSETGAWKTETTSRGEQWKYLDLSGRNLGARIEELAPGETSSVHHFHTAEEEHVFVLEGDATLHAGAEAQPLSSGDHVWFEACKEIPHHIDNTSGASFRFLVFGERDPQDIVVYPDQQVLMVKGLEQKQYTYREIPTGK